MSQELPTNPWTLADMDDVLALLPTFEAPGLKPCEWQGNDLLADGSRTMPFPIYHPEVEKLLSLTARAWIHPYETLAEDELGLDPQQIVFTPDSFTNATLSEIRRYFSLCKRRERFCDGYIAGDFKNGVMLAAFARLKILRDRLASGEG